MVLAAVPPHEMEKSVLSFVPLARPSESAASEEPPEVPGAGVVRDLRPSPRAKCARPSQVPAGLPGGLPSPTSAVGGSSDDLAPTASTMAAQPRGW